MIDFFQKKPIRLGILFAIMAIAAYFNTFQHGFVWDDSLVITKNTYTTQGVNGLIDIWTKEVFLHNRHVYRPVPQTLFALEWEFFPNNPTAFHVIHVFLYALTCFWAFYFLQQMFPSISVWLLGFIGLLYTLHPVHTEVVANIKSADEILACLFGILSMISIIRITEKKWHWILVFIASFTAAILSKISAITLLPVFLLIIFYKSKATTLVQYLKITSANTISFTKKSFQFLISKEPMELNKSTWFLFTSLCALSVLSILGNIQWLAVVCFTIILFLQFRIKEKPFLNISILIQMILIGFMGWKEVLFIYFVVASILWLDKKAFFAFASILFLAFQFYFKDFIGGAIYGIVIPSLLFLINKRRWYLVFILITPVIAMLYAKFNIPLLLVHITAIILLLLHLKKNIKPSFIISLLTSLLLIGIIIFTKHDNSLSYKANDFLFPVENPIQTTIAQESTQEETIMMTTLNNSLLEKNGIEKYSTIAAIQLKYLQLSIFPYPLVHQHGINQIPTVSIDNWKVWVSVIIHFLLFFIALFYLNKKHPIAFGILFYFFTISIYTNIIRLMPDTLAERFLFVPSLGFCIALVFGLHEFLKRNKQRNFILGAIAILFMIGFFYQTTNRNKDWKNSFTLAANTVKYAPENAAINAQYAGELNVYYLQNPHEATVTNDQVIEKHFKKALEIYPDFYSVITDLGTFYSRKEKPDEAFPYLLNSIELQPKSWIGHYYIGFIYAQREEFEEAISHLEDALAFNNGKMTDGENVQAQGVLAKCYFSNKNATKAIAILQESYITYGQKESYILLANIYRQIGNQQKSLETFLLLQNDFPDDIELQKAIQIMQSNL